MIRAFIKEYIDILNGIFMPILNLRYNLNAHSSKMPFKVIKTSVKNRIDIASRVYAWLLRFCSHLCVAKLLNLDLLLVKYACVYLS